MVNSVTIQDSTLSSGQSGVVIVDAANASFQRIYVSEFVDTLFLIAVVNMTLQDSILSNGGAGVRMYGFTECRFATCKSSALIQETIVSSMYKALAFHQVSKVSIFKSLITDNIIGLSGEDVETFTCMSCMFLSNKIGGIILRNTLSATVLSGCTFHNNQGSPITLYQSTIELKGETVFRDNTAERGGGIALFDSKVIFSSASATTFVNNTAQTGGGLALFDSITIFEASNTTFLKNTAEKFGGAIYINALPTILKDEIVYNETGKNAIKITNLAQQKCFFLTNYTNSLISFTDNKANLGGLDVYGATIYTEDCSLYSKMFQFDNKSKSFHISSDPLRVCFCIDNEPRCEDRTYLMLSEMRYPGESFTASVVLTGYNLGRVAGSVYTNVLGRDYKEVIRESQHIQPVELMECTNINYTVSASDSVVLELTAEEEPTKNMKEMFTQEKIQDAYSETCSIPYLYPCVALLTTPIFINVTLEPCPLGFNLNIANGMCECAQELKNIKDEHSFTCKIQNHTGYIDREGTVWVGVDTDENNSDMIYYWHRHCPRDYCSSLKVSIELMFPDKQCSSNRSGVLCGRCQTGYSLQLGGNKCIECNNWNYLTLLVVFAVLGILLVALIKLLDLTVTSGTISGLIFYANVVWRNNAILFSLQDRQNIGYYVVTLPIAWINLDFGIETCFTENLDQLTKTGLQFVFPVYIWCIAGLIIMICHYSTRATKLFGNNSVAVLATLFLLSYGKLLRNITDVFTFDVITDSNGTTRKVWSLDGNVQYGVAPGHIVLIVAAFIFFILFLLPFTLTFFLVPFLRAKSHHRPLQWINSLKPFYDTYYGPFKDKKQHQVWTGILLISRVMILIVHASASNYSPNANVLLMTIIAALLLMYSATVGLLYKKWTLSLLENIYILNLKILGGAFLFQNMDIRSNDALSTVSATSVVIALFCAICTVMGHVMKKLMSTKTIKTCLKRSDKPFEEVPTHSPEADPLVVDTEEEEVKPTVHVIEIQRYDPTKLRETLLESPI